MNVTLIKKPYPLSYSGNAMPFVFAIAPYGANEKTQTILLQVRVLIEDSYGTNVFNEIYSQTFYPDDSGMISMDVHTLIHPYLEYGIPKMNLPYGKVKEAEAQRKRYKINWLLQLNGDVITDLTESPVLSAIKGGMSYAEWNPATAFSNNNTAMHFAASGEMVGTDQEVFFWWRMSAAGSGFLRFSYQSTPVVPTDVFPFTNMNPTLVSIVVPVNEVMDENSVWYTRVSLYSLIAATPGLNDQLVMNFTIDFLNASEVVTASKRYTVDQRPFYQTFHLLYRNSLGGMDSMRLRGQVDFEADYQRTEATRAMAPSYYSNGNLMPETVQQDNEETERFKGDTGFMSREALINLRDFFLSAERYEAINKRVIPIALTGNTVKFFSNKDTLYTTQVEWRRAFTNLYYTPAAYLAVDPSCPALESFSITQVGSSALQVLYSAPFGYDNVQLILDNGSGTTTYYFNKNADSVLIPFDLSQADTIHAIARVMCDADSEPPSAGPASIVDLTIEHNALPIARDDTYTINSGFNTAVHLTGSTMANDYDPDGDPIEVIVASGSTHDGGTYSIDAAGSVQYQPPTSAYIGTDYFDYSIRNVGGTDTVSARVFIKVGSTTPIFIKLIIESTTVVTYSPIGSLITWMRKQTTGKVYLRFFANAAGTIPLDVTGRGIAAHIHLWEKTVAGWLQPEVITETDSSVACSSFTTLVFQGILYNQYYRERFIGSGLELFEYDEKKYTLLAGSGYTVI